MILYLFRKNEFPASSVEKLGTALRPLFDLRRFRLPETDLVAIWIPRRDEFDLARSLSLTDHPTFENAEQVMQSVADDLRSRGYRVRIGRWHVQKVIRAMRAVEADNTPQGRAAAVAHLARERDEGAQ